MCLRQGAFFAYGNLNSVKGEKTRDLSRVIYGPDNDDIYIYSIDKSGYILFA